MKQNLVLLHGALGTEKQLTPIKERLKEKFNTYSFNFEGHGDRISNESFSIPFFSTNLVDFLVENGLEQPAIFGFSMGGYVALNTTIEHPGRIGKIVTLGTKFSWSPEIALQEVKQLNPDKIIEKIPSYADKLKKEHLPGDWRLVMNKTAAMMSKMGDNVPLNFNALAKIENQVVIGIGNKDRMVGIEESKKIADQIPNGHLQIIEGFKHPIDTLDIDELEKYIVNALK